MPMGGAAGTPIFASIFDGTNDYLTRGADLTGIADGKQGTVSLWLKKNADATRMFFLHGVNATAATRYSLEITTGNVFIMFAAESGGTTRLDIRSASQWLTTDGWIHFLASWKLDTVGARHLYINDADDISVTTFTDGTIDYTLSDHSVGARTNGNDKANANLAELYFTTTYLDLSVEANRRKFITASGKPADLGPDGSRPTGASPIIYLRHPASQFGTNSGTGGNFTINGALTAATTRP